MKNIMKYKIFPDINKFLYINILYINIISPVEISVVKTNFDIYTRARAHTHTYTYVYVLC